MISRVRSRLPCLYQFYLVSNALQCPLFTSRLRALSDPYWLLLIYYRIQAIRGGSTASVHVAHSRRYSRLPVPRTHHHPHQLLRAEKQGGTVLRLVNK